jgi:hypothetical protein
MAGEQILTLVTGAYDVLKSVGLRICDLFAMDKVDQTKLAELKNQQAIAQINFEGALKQAELWFAEKMMINAKWTTPMALITGCSIVLACLFNIVCLTFNFSKFEVTFWTPAFIILIAMFIFSASGSSKLLISVTEYLIEHLKQNEPKKPNSP